MEPVEPPAHKKSWVELHVNDSMEAGNDSLSTTVAWCTSYITTLLSREPVTTRRQVKDSNTWQSLIGSVWGLQDLLDVINTNSNVQWHHYYRVHVTAIKVSLPVVRNTVAVVVATVWYIGRYCSTATAAINNLTQLEHPTVAIFRHGHNVVTTLRYSNSSNGLEMSL